MEDQTQTTQPVQDQTVEPVDSTDTQTSTPPTDTTITQPEATPVDQTHVDTLPAETTASPDVSTPAQPKILTGADVLASYGLVEIYDARLGAFCQVKKEDAQKMLESLDSLRTALGV